MHLTKSGKPNPHAGRKFLQHAVQGVEEGMKIYGTLKGAWDVGRSVYGAVRTAAVVAAPYMEAAALMMV